VTGEKKEGEVAETHWTLGVRRGNHGKESVGAPSLMRKRKKEKRKGGVEESRERVLHHMDAVVWRYTDEGDNN